MTETIEAGTVVTLHYVLRFEDGETFDSSETGLAGMGLPAVYLHGYGNVVPGLERALDGRAVGDKFHVRVPPEESWGLPDPAAVQQIPRDSLPAGVSPQRGMQMPVQGPDGGVYIGWVTAVEDAAITVDGNHPFAGEVLNFDVEVLELRAATPTELEHGTPLPEGDRDAGDHVCPDCSGH